MFAKLLRQIVEGWSHQPMRWWCSQKASVACSQTSCWCSHVEADVSAACIYEYIFLLYIYMYIYIIGHYNIGYSIIWYCQFDGCSRPRGMEGTERGLRAAWRMTEGPWLCKRLLFFFKQRPRSLMDRGPFFSPYALRMGARPGEVHTGMKM